jgi:hypothetical protein
VLDFERVFAVFEAEYQLALTLGLDFFCRRDNQTGDKDADVIGLEPAQTLLPVGRDSSEPSRDSQSA